MKPRGLKGCAGTLAATALATIMGLSVPAYGTTLDVTLPAGAKENGGNPVAAQAIITTSLNTVTVTLKDLLANPTTVAQLISDVFFTLSGSTSGSGSVSPTATSYINVADNGTASAAGAVPAVYAYTDTSNTVHLTGIGSGTTGPCCLIIGPAGAGGVYTNANDSITGNDPHNPFLNQTATFTLALAGVTAATTISNVIFSFGTAEGNNVAVPIPAAAWLFVSGLLGLIGIARRKHSGVLTASPVAA